MAKSKKSRWEELGIPLSVSITRYSFTPDTATLKLQLPDGEIISVSVSPGESVAKIKRAFDRGCKTMLSDLDELA